MGALENYVRAPAAGEGGARSQEPTRRAASEWAEGAVLEMRDGDCSALGAMGCRPAPLGVGTPVVWRNCQTGMVGGRQGVEFPGGGGPSPIKP